MKKLIAILVWTTLFLGMAVPGVVLAEDMPPITAPGMVLGVGTHFELADSEYLNVTVDSTEEINFRLGSVPEMVTMHFESVSSATSTVITLGGFLPQTTYYKYEDNYHNLEAFTTDESGSYCYTQDISTEHLVFIQPRPSTIFLSDSGWSKPVGTWDPVTKTGTLTTDVSETIQIDSDNITLDGNGYTITGTRTGFGVYLYGRTGVTVKDLTITNFSYGIYVLDSSNNTLINNTANLNYSSGIYLFSSTSTYPNNTHTENTHTENTLINNTANENGGGGIIQYFCDGNTFINNTTNSNGGSGIYLFHSSYNTLTGNTANSNSYGGINLFWMVNDNSFTDNTVSMNKVGIHLETQCYRNIITGNTVSLNYVGFRAHCSCNNQVYNNNFIDNTEQATVLCNIGSSPCPSDNDFNLAKPIGGNYWSDWTSPDSDGDGFVDEPYVFDDVCEDGQDYLPWAVENGWLKQPANIDIDPDTLNLKSKGNWITCYIEFSEGYYVDQVDINTVKLSVGSATPIAAALSPTEVGDYDSDDIPDLMVKFDRGAVQAVVTPGSVEMTVTGSLTDGTQFQGTDTVLVIDKGKEHTSEADHSSVVY